MTDFNFDTDTEAQNETATDDNFEQLASDLMGAYAALVTAVAGFARIAPGQLGAAIGVVGDMATALGADFALRGMVLAGEVSQEDADTLAAAFGGNAPSEIEDEKEYVAPETDAA